MWAVRLSNKFVQAWGRCTTVNRDMIKTNSNIIAFQDYSLHMANGSSKDFCMLHNVAWWTALHWQWTAMDIAWTWMSYNLCQLQFQAWSRVYIYIHIYIYLKYTHQKLSLYIYIEVIDIIRMSRLYSIVLMQTKPATNTFILPSINIES